MPNPIGAIFQVARHAHGVTVLIRPRKNMSVRVDVSGRLLAACLLRLDSLVMLFVAHLVFLLVGGWWLILNFVKRIVRTMDGFVCLAESRLRRNVKSLSDIRKGVANLMIRRLQQLLNFLSAHLTCPPSLSHAEARRRGDSSVPQA
jgi:hypothetical protein